MASYSNLSTEDTSTTDLGRTGYTRLSGNSSILANFYIMSYLYKIIDFYSIRYMVASSLPSLSFSILAALPSRNFFSAVRSVGVSSLSWRDR